MNSTIQQLADTFASPPGLDGVLHGVRQVIQGKHGSRSSLFYSRKNDALMPVESRLELATCYQLEWEPKIVRYRMQPIEVRCGSKIIYPDCCVQDQQGNYRVLEVKPTVYWNTSRNLAKFDYLRDHFARHGVDFEVIGEDYGGCSQVRANRSMIYDRGGNLKVEQYQIEAWLKPIFEGPRSLRISDARSILRDFLSPPHSLEVGIFSGQLQCDLTQKIDANTVLEVCA